MKASRLDVWTWTGCGIVAAIMALVVWLPPTRLLEAYDAAIELPRQVGDWNGQPLAYCQSEACMKAFLAERVKGLDECPLCGAPLGQVNLAVLRGLPSDTIVRTMSYALPLREEPIHVALVTSGRHQRSIHRPEKCLPAQGYVIQESIPLKVPLDDGSTLDARLIHAQSESVSLPPILFAYWFRGGPHETSSHWRRLFLMSRDLLVDNVANPWLYVSVQMPGQLDDERIETMRSFIALLHPALEPSSQ